MAVSSVLLDVSEAPAELVGLSRHETWREDQGEPGADKDQRDTPDGSPGEGQQRHQPEQELQPVEDEQDGGEDELHPEDEGLQQQDVDGERHARNQEQEGGAGGEGALAQVPLPP